MASQEEQQATSDSWGTLDRRFRGPLRSFFVRRTKSLADAEDLTQEVFVRLIRNPDRHGGTSIEAYVFTIASSVLRDWKRSQLVRHGHAHVALLDASDAPNISETPPALVEEKTPERVLIAKDALRGLEESLNQMSVRTRDIFLLSRVEHIPHREIANSFGISISAVEKHIIKAVEYLAARAFKS